MKVHYNAVFGVRGEKLKIGVVFDLEEDLTSGSHMVIPYSEVECRTLKEWPTILCMLPGVSVRP